MIIFSVDRSTGVRIARFTGVINDAMLLDAYGSLVNAPDYDPRLHDLVDLRGTDRLEVTQAAMRTLIGMYDPVDALGVPTRLAIVAASDFTFGMSRMYELLRGEDVPELVRVFRSIDEANVWLTNI